VRPKRDYRAIQYPHPDALIPATADAATAIATAVSSARTTTAGSRSTTARAEDTKADKTIVMQRT
jgi:hypothetical protein